MVLDHFGYDSASILWNDFENIDQSQFKHYVIRVKKRYTTVEDETPRTISSLASTYDIIELDSSVDYEISVAIDTFDFGQSVWSESIMMQTQSLSDSDLSEVDQLKKQVVSLTFITETLKKNLKVTSSNNSKFSQT